MRLGIALSVEQASFVDAVLDGRNVLVDACWGSGKTTAIQALCDELAAEEGTRVLYLTFNRLLKDEARRRVANRATDVFNYHALAKHCLALAGYGDVPVQDAMVAYERCRDFLWPQMAPYDVIVIDEYQDISAPYVPVIEDAVSAVNRVRGVCPRIVAVGDMDQKIYDKSALDPLAFVRALMEWTGRPTAEVPFTKSFRLGPDVAEPLGRIFRKRVEGVNSEARAMELSLDEAIDLVSDMDPADVICLGSRYGKPSQVLNRLEERCPDVWNKRTVYSTVGDGERGALAPEGVGVVTTFDAAKGLERAVSVVCDFDSAYWNSRVTKPEASPWILRNIFGVGATRGKAMNVFVRPESEKVAFLVPETLERAAVSKRICGLFPQLQVRDSFEHRFEEHIEAAYGRLSVERLDDGSGEVICARMADELIDLSACVGLWAQALYFDDFDVTEYAERWVRFRQHRELTSEELDYADDRKVLLAEAAETGQERYVKQVEGPLLEPEAVDAVRRRLAEHVAEDVPCECEVDFDIHLKRRNSDRAAAQGKVSFLGFADAIADDTVWEFKFTGELAHTDFLQVGAYLLGLEEGIEARLLNIRTGELWAVSIPDRDAFAAAVLKVATKGAFSEADYLSCRPA